MNRIPAFCCIVVFRCALCIDFTWENPSAPNGPERLLVQKIRYQNLKKSINGLNFYFITVFPTLHPLHHPWRVRKYAAKHNVALCPRPTWINFQFYYQPHLHCSRSDISAVSAVTSNEKWLSSFSPGAVRHLLRLSFACALNAGLYAENMRMFFDIMGIIVIIGCYAMDL
jgi:hypothetical protein